jgi:hypothetical protein
LPAAHCVSAVHAEGHAAEAPLQRKGAQLGLPVLPAVTGAQVPTLPVTLQALHAPSQAESQQTPSTQWPVPHWESAEQDWAASFFFSQVPPLQ